MRRGKSQRVPTTDVSDEVIRSHTISSGLTENPYKSTGYEGIFRMNTYT
jgi:hypothetical protein